MSHQSLILLLQHFNFALKSAKLRLGLLVLLHVHLRELGQLGLFGGL